MVKNKKSNENFIISDRFEEQDLKRPDVPEWYDNELLMQKHKRENHHENKSINNDDDNFKAPIVWRNVFSLTILHILGIYGFYVGIRHARWQSIVWSWAVGTIGGLGVLAGAHRLWTHRSYKAHWSLRIFLMLMHTMSLQNDLFEWARDHRTHHKYSETNADPHDSRRGFFFSHVGWLLCRKHPEVKRKGSTIDMSDIWSDPIVRFQRRFYVILVIIFWGAFPVLVPVYFWNENFWLAVMGNFFRYLITLHHTWTVNSLAHMYGYQPYDKTVQPRENRWVSYMTFGEGYHNYHHVFPWDYSASEHNYTECFNVATAFIDLCAWLGLASDRRIVSRELIENRSKRCGDNSSEYLKKSRSIIIEYLFGLIANAWILVVFYILRMIFYIGEN